MLTSLSFSVLLFSTPLISKAQDEADKKAKKTAGPEEQEGDDDEAYLSRKRKTIVEDSDDE